MSHPVRGSDALDYLRRLLKALVLRVQNLNVSFEFSLKVSSGLLRYEPVVGRRTFYASLTFGPQRFWIQRWATDACRHHPIVAISRDRLMCWTRGRSVDVA